MMQHVAMEFLCYCMSVCYHEFMSNIPIPTVLFLSFSLPLKGHLEFREFQIYEMSLTPFNFTRKSSILGFDEKGNFCVILAF